MTQDNKIAHQPEWDALNKFDVENNVLPARQIAFSIVTRHPDVLLDDEPIDGLIDDIAHAIEDAMEFGQKRGKFIPPVCPLIGAAQGVLKQWPLASISHEPMIDELVRLREALS